MASPSSHGLILGSVPHVNLMPRSEIERRGRKVLIHRWLLILIAALLLVGIVVLGGFSLKIAADLRLASENERTTALLAELSSLSDVSDMLRQEADLTSFRTEALGTDLTWSRLLGATASVLPAGSAITNFAVEAAGIGRTGGEPQDLPGPAVVMTVTSATPLDVVGVIRAMRGATGIYAADGIELRKEAVTADPDAPILYSYVLTILAAEEMYTGRFAPEEPAAAEED